ncbi:transcriptional regulator [Thioalkalivibrio denitrificans]|uniref:Transcriptional regulator n=1 Tax=Thioalkalivibrio denitrificans TaxID=108003 RepID=A0A1V3NCC9_9GAMM|nr:helix-turn-helix transcriptional regulator [Thioalkalivibrio denitrificans]OOG22757.1 transcriptional regulator [Thioalkalivibrio denitrificans]
MSAKIQIIERDGVPEYAVVPFDEFDRLRKLAEAMEDIRAFDTAMADEGEPVPQAIMQRLVDGDPPLRVWREYRGLTQAQLAQQAGVDKTYISQIESGRKTGSVKILRQLADALEVELDDLV